MTYRVYGKYVGYGHVDINANSKEEAYEKAENMSEEKWEIDECGCWETGECEVVDD